MSRRDTINEPRRTTAHRDGALRGPLSRRAFGQTLAAGALAAGCASGVRARDTYSGPKIIILRFGGGVRRRECIDPAHSYAPYTLRRLAARGTLLPDLRIAPIEGVETGHAEGTLNLLTGRYLAYRPGTEDGSTDHLTPTAPTLFEYLRKRFEVPAHRALLINGEDRPQEEFFAFGDHGHYGVRYRSEVLSLYRFKRYVLRRRIALGEEDEKALETARRDLAALDAKDYRQLDGPDDPAIDRFWESWLDHYGDGGLVNPRGDRLLTELGLRALAALEPDIMMVNYQDPDYVHWGNASHYTRAIAIIDQGIERLVAAADHHPAYHGRTVFVVVPDCGRDANPLLDVPYQHHFNSRSAREIWGIFAGAGIARGRIIERPADQIDIAPTVAQAMQVDAAHATGRVLGDVFA